MVIYRQWAHIFPPRNWYGAVFLQWEYIINKWGFYQQMEIMGCVDFGVISTVKEIRMVMVCLCPSGAAVHSWIVLEVMALGEKLQHEDSVGPCWLLYAVRYSRVHIFKSWWTSPCVPWSIGCYPDTHSIGGWSSLHCRLIHPLYHWIGSRENFDTGKPHAEIHGNSAVGR